MATAFTIAGVDKLALLQNAWQITKIINGRNTMSCRVVSQDGSYRPTVNAEVAFEHDSVTFGGFIHDVDEAAWNGVGGSGLAFDVELVDYSSLPDRRQVEITIPGGSTVKQALQQIVEFVTDFGVTLSGAQVDGPTLEEDVVIEVGPLTGVLDKLSTITAGLGINYIWDIDDSKVLRMFEAGTTNFSFAGGVKFALGDVTVNRSSGESANHVTVWYTQAARAAYVYFSTLDNHTDDNMSDTETATVDGRVYTFQATLTNVDGHVLIGATAEDTLTNLVAAITRGAGNGTTYAEATVVHGTVRAYMEREYLMTVEALVAGVAGNSISVSTTCADAFWTVGGTSASPTLQFGADEALTGRAVAQYRVAITSNSAANPTVLTTAVPHRFESGDTIDIASVAASTPTINGVRVATRTGASTLTVPVNVTVPGTGGTAQFNAASLRERVYKHPEIRHEATAQALADGYLERCMASHQTVSYTTRMGSGITPGQTQTWTEASRGIDGQFLVTDVVIKCDGKVVTYDIALSESTVIPTSPLDIFREWSRTSSSSLESATRSSTSALAAASAPNTPFPLGGSAGESVMMAPTPGWLPSVNYLSYFPRVSFTALVRVWQWVRPGGTTVESRLRNVTDSTTVGQSAAGSDTSRPASAVVFYAALEAGKEYRLEVLGGSADVDVFNLGTLEAAG